ncbi:uncharacterized protein LOC114520096 [Dendronephthya gigantea]|uniref:uncharacterized protein LOC114520096 n=1 Tax=Dendronephthya gigantea TaxID=151771 RepID=UPI00106AC231|nr:uncharacterized protein LOC114520096 [Dendronephthya gigantea]
MLISNGDSAIDILKESLVELKEETITIFGSRFEEDSSDAYNYRILSRIILCMERNCTLILKDLENIYGSLYDMLNQNYAVVGNTKNCRVALGAYSNPMCQVNEGFRCIVLVDQVDCSDPPFLNRFEKQLLRFSDVLTIDQQNIITNLRHWVLGMSRVKGLESHFKEIDMFIGFYEDTLPSLVLSHGRDTDSSTLEKCKDELMWIASPDGVLRTRKCTYLNEDSQQVEKLRKKYFNGLIHQGFSVFVEHVISQPESSFFAGDEISSKMIVMTFANIHTDIRQCLEASLKLKCQAERLGAYKSEKQLTEMINKYWNAPEKELLVLQCKPDLDGKHLLLARFIIEEERNAYKRGLTGKKARGKKHVCIVVHVRRGEEADVSWQFNFVSRWRLVFLDVLEPPPIPLNEILGKSVKELLSSSIWPLKKIAQSQLLWCFTCLKYTSIQRPLRTVFHIAKNLLKSEAVSKVIKQLILESIDLKASKHQGTYSDWQVEVACDRQALVNSSTLYYAMKQFVSRLVRNPLCKIVYFLEKENAWPPHLTQEPNDIMKTKLEDLWCQLLVETKIFKMSDIPELLGAESCVVESTSLDLSLPFSQLVSRKVDDVKELFLEDYAKLLENDDDDKKAKKRVREQQVKRFTVMITNLVPELSAYTFDCYDLYMKDILDMTTANFSQTLSRSIRVSIAQAVFVSEERPDLPPDDMAEFCTLLHTFVWVNRKQISDLMQMICVCKPFIGLEVLAGLIEGILCSSEEVRLSQTLPSDQEEAFTETGRLRDIVVTAYCEQMFPSPTNVEKNGGPYAWTRNANLLLSSATKISEYPPALHYLRLCVDFSRIILPLNSSLLNTLNEIGMALKPEYLDNDKSFEMVTTYLIAPLKEGIRDNDDKKEALLKFLALFYGRCIDTNVDAFCVRSIIEQVLSLKESKFAMMMSPVVLRLLEVEETQTPGIFMDTISNPSALEDCPCLLNIDEAFKNLCSIDHDSYPAVMICDLIGLLLKFDRFKSGDRSKSGTFKFDDVNSPNCEVLLLAKSAINLISQNTEDERGLRILAAVAFLRRFITKLAEFIAKNPGVMINDGPYTHVLNEINSLLRKPKIPLREFFVKTLHKHLSLFDLEKLSTQNEVLPTVKNLWPNDALYQDKAVFTSVLMFSEYKEAKVAYLKLLSNDDSSMRGFLKTANRSPNHAFALLGVLINMIYLKRAVRRITDKEAQIAMWFVNKINSFPRMFQELLLRIIGRRDFHCSQLQLSTESSVNEVEMALLILHVACVVATSSLNEKMPIYWYFTKPFKFTQPCVLAHCKEMRSVFQHLPSVEESARATCCSCGLRLAFKSNINETVCPHCQEALKDETEYIASSETFSTQSLLSSCCNSSLDSDLCTKEMRPAVFRALHLIVYSSYYAGIALGTSTGEDVSRVLNIVHGYDPKIDTKSSADFCFEIIESDLLHLMKILNSQKDVVMKTMHLVLERSSALIRSKDLLGSNDCSTPEMCREWEDEFAKHTKAVLLKSRKLSMEIKGMIKLQQTNDSQAKVTLEDWILELDEYPEHREDKNQQLKRLFRMTKQPCFEDFRSAFLHSPEKIQSKHSFLSLFFAKFEQIRIGGHLYHLLKWSRLVSSALSHRVSRKDAESKSINDFITGHLLQLNRTPEEKSSLKASFEKFQKAWNEVCLLVDQTNNKEKMPSLMETDYVAYCLTEGEYGIHLRNAIEILVSHQNSILDAIISLSSRHHPALSFLEQENYSSVAIASIQNVQEKEIINFQWSDELLKYTPRNLEYGKGHEIAYDFERIEIWLAETIAFGKCYLTGTLNEFIFAKELFHSYGPLLTEFRQLIKPCITLPKDVRKDLDELKEQRIKDAQDLLQHIEVLIFLLKRNLKNINVDMTLKVFTENCPTEIPFPIELLPQSGSSIKIEHVAALYEALEDVLADGAIEGLDGKFRKQMTDGMEKTVTAMTNRTTGGVQLKASDFLRVLRRFVFRYLSSEKYWPEESTTLQNHLKKPSLWFPLKPPNMDDIPKEITLEYIYSIVKYLEEEKKKANTSGKVTNFGGRRQLRKVSHIA